MKIFKPAVLVFLLLLSSQTLAGGDCAVAYAHMQNGNYKQAYAEFRELAERGYAYYINIVADMHARGLGVPASDMMAHVWYSLSAALDDEKGIQGQSELVARLSKQQRIDSAYLAHEYAREYLQPYVVSYSLQTD
jgi:TPR repeat protein